MICRHLRFTSHMIATETGPARPETPNVLYRFLRSAGLPMALLCPGVAIAMAFPLTYYFNANVEWAYRTAVLISLFHYYTDSFMWKKGSVHRQYIQVA